MRIAHVVIVFFVATFVAVSAFAQIQADSLLSDYDKGVVSALLASIPVEPFKREGGHYGDARFYPIGISQSGRLAYLKYMTNPQYIQWDFIILDLVEDAVLRKRSGEPHDYAEPPGEHLKAEAIAKDLHDFGIYLSRTPLELQTFPLKYGDDFYNVELKEVEGYDDDFIIDKPYTVHLVSTDKGSKRLTQIKCSPSTPPSVAGFLVSPFEHRIAVIVRYDVAFIEAESAGSFAVTGGHLLVGFR